LGDRGSSLLKAASALSKSVPASHHPELRAPSTLESGN